MRNNLETLGAIENTKSPAITETKSLSFSVPTEMVDLPSKGKFYPKEHPWHLKESVEIKLMSAVEEEILVNKAYIKKGSVFDKLIESILVEKDSVNLKTVLPGDKNAILLAARIASFGEKYQATVMCPVCFEVGKEFFDLTEVDVVLLDNVEFNEDNTFNVPLPVTGFTAVCRLLNGEDEEKLTSVQNSKIRFAEKTIKDPEKLKKAKEELENIPTSEQFKLCVRSVNGVTDSKMIAEFLEKMPAKDSRALKAALKEHTPNIDLSYSFKCAACKSESNVQIPITKDFFWGD
jgi:DNA-directed RNA polymerase subunit F